MAAPVLSTAEELAGVAPVFVTILMPMLVIVVLGCMARGAAGAQTRATQRAGTLTHARPASGYPGRMQTFLPCTGFTASAEVLDVRRLGKQRVETIQVLRALTVPGYGWRHHPAAAMWAGYEEALARYGLDVCAVWCAQGRGDTCAATLQSDLAAGTGLSGIRTQDELSAAGELPPWIGDTAFHLSHRSALVRKDPGHYRTWFPDVPDDLPYVWPVSDRPRRVAVG